MSATLQDSPEPGLEGESQEFIKFAESMTPEKTKVLAERLVQLYKEQRTNVDT
jgi:hypothetical protein